MEIKPPVAPGSELFQVRQRPLVGVVLAVAQHEVRWFGKGDMGRFRFYQVIGPRPNFHRDQGHPGFGPIPPNGGGER